MKWKFELIESLVVLLQISVLFFAWWHKYLINDDAPLFLALAVFVIGLVGALLIFLVWKISDGEESKSLESMIRWLAAFLGVVGAYLVFIPAISIFVYGGIAPIVFLVGFVLPMITSRALLKRFKRSNNLNI